MDPVEVNVGVPETDVHLVRIGQKADITVPALPGKSFQGTVRVINVSADPNTRTYMTRISVANREHELRVGMVAEATIRGDRTISMATLPGDAVVRDPQGATQVYVYYPDQKRVYTKRVEIGAAVNKDVEIMSGLSGNELIVLAGQTKLRNGLTVSATEQRPVGNKPRLVRGTDSMTSDKVFASLPPRHSHIDGDDRNARRSCLPENAADGRSDDHHQNRACNGDVSRSDVRAGGKTGNKDP